MKRLFLSLLIAFSFNTAFAEDYYWLLYSPNGIASYVNFPSPSAACSAISRSAVYSNPTQFLCTNSTFYASRAGVSCPSGRVYDQQNGICTCPTGTVEQAGQCVEENPCTTKLGQSQSFTKSGTSGDGYGTVSGGFVAGVQSACFSGCAVSTVDQKCTGRVTGAYTCRGTAYYSGQTCATTGNSTEIQENTSQLPLPNPQTISEEKPCVYSQDGATQVCQSSVNNEKEGQFCGEYNGVKKCVDAKPTKNGIVIDTKVETENNPDGSKVVTKTDTATKTVCTGANQCNSTTTTTTTKTSIDANGNTTGTTGSCTGDACPDKNTNPDGDGDGFGDCTGDDCGEGSGGSFNTPEFEEVGTIAETTSAFIARVDASPLLSTVSSIGLSGQGSCSMGSTSTTIGTISASSICDNSHWLDPLYFIFLAIHALAAVRVFLSA